MLEIFRTNQFFASLLLLPYTFLVRIQSLIKPVAYEVQDTDTAVVKYIYQNVLDAPLRQSIIACILVFLTANFINRHIIQNRLSKQQSLIPGLLFILISAGIPGGMSCTPVLISSCLIMLGTTSINRIYKTNEYSTRIFNSGLYYALAFLIYPANLILWIFAVIAILILRSFKLRELLILTCAMFIPVFLMGTYYYWNGELHLLGQYFQVDNGIIGIFFNSNLQTLLYLAAIAIIVLFTIFRYNNYTMKNAIQVQKKIDIIYWFMFFTLPMMFFVNEAAFNHLILLAIPFSMLIGFSFEKLKNKLIAEVIHLAMIVSIIVSHFY